MVRGELADSGNVPLMPPARIGSRLNYRTESFSSYISVLTASDQNDTGNFEQPTDGYTRWDAGVNYVVPIKANAEALLFLKLKNITDEEIRQSVSLLRDQAPEAGRAIVAGIRLSF
jgi:iron complex outermembrane receptor protein